MRKDAARGSALTDRKIFTAILMGVLLGGVAAVLHVRSRERSLLLATNNDSSGEGDPNVGLRRRLEELTNQKARLETQVADVIAERDSAVSRLKGGTAAINTQLRVKAGPFGTVHFPTKSPTVVPDPSVNSDLASLLETVAINKELIVGLSNIYIRDMLLTWFTSIKRVGISNFLVIALDDETVRFCQEHEVPVFRKKAVLSDDGKEASGNHGISGTKFNLIRDFLSLGYSVFLSDIDIVFLQNPFLNGHLRRDCDVEGMSDGFDNATAYGYNDVMDDPSMGWARYVHTMRIFVMNSGLFYLRPTVASIELLDRVRARLTQDPKAWDQAVFNEEMFFPSSPQREGLYISRRILDHYNFMNSKVLFKEVRKNSRFEKHLPVSIHVNYHPEKHPRMLAIVEYYVNGKKDALNPFPDGSM